MRKFIGLDIGGTKCAAVLAGLDLGIRILDKVHFDTRSERGFEPVYRQLCESVDALLHRNGLKASELTAIGISCGGPLDAKSGLILSPPNLPGWDRIPLPAMLEKRYGIPAYLQNDANACALTEWKLGAGRGTDNMIFLTMGTGMGAGVIAEGRLLIGNSGMGGEVGHLRLTEDGPVGFGKPGSFEGYTSGGGIGSQARQLTRELIAGGRTPSWIRDGHPEEEVDARLMARYAAAGDEDARGLFAFAGRMLGRGLALLVDAFNPERIVIGSIFTRCESLLRPAMEEELKKEALEHSLRGLRVVPAQTGEQLGDLASVMAALHALGLDPMEEGSERDEKVLAHYDRLFARYPNLENCRDSVMQAYLAMLSCYRKGGKLLIAGNGGSAADSEHIAGELMKGFYLKRPLSPELREAVRAKTDSLLPGAAALLQQGLPAIALTGQTALSTAAANDLDPLLPFAQQVVGYGRRGDALLVLSTSGRARNLALAAQMARALGITAIGLLGRDGGMLKEYCDISIIVPGGDTAAIQELHLPVYHTLCAMLEAKLFVE